FSRDWSSDVCSSDLGRPRPRGALHLHRRGDGPGEGPEPGPGPPGAEGDLGGVAMVLVALVAEGETLPRPGREALSLARTLVDGGAPGPVVAAVTGPGAVQDRKST